MLDSSFRWNDIRSGSCFTLGSRHYACGEIVLYWVPDRVGHDIGGCWFVGIPALALRAFCLAMCRWNEKDSKPVNGYKTRIQKRRDRLW